MTREQKIWRLNKYCSSHNAIKKDVEFIKNVVIVLANFLKL